MQKNKFLSPFFISLISGLIVWLVVYIITPVSPVNKFNLSTLLFIILSYVSLAVGYLVMPKLSFKPRKSINAYSLVWLVIFLVLFGFTIRFIDLFFYRGLRFSNSIHQNRDLATQTLHHFFFLIGSLPKYLFFTPLILVFFLKSTNKKLITISSLLFLLPLVEAILRGSRGPFLISFSIFIIVLLFYNKLKLNKKTVFSLIISMFILVIISSSLLAKREGEKKNPTNLYKSLLTEARYNDLLAPKNSVYQWFDKSDSKTLKKGVVDLLHIGQYYTHAVFEFNFLLQQKNIPKQYGKHTFSIIPKLLNHTGISNYDLNKIQESSPRLYTFIGFLGSMYIDYGWYTFIFLFFFGVIQKIVYEFVRNSYFYFSPLFIYFLFTNFFILSFNFYAGNGTSILIVCVIFAFFNFIYSKYATSTNS